MHSDFVSLQLSAGNAELVIAKSQKRESDERLLNNLKPFGGMFARIFQISHRRKTPKCLDVVCFENKSRTNRRMWSGTSSQSLRGLDAAALCLHDTFKANIHQLEQRFML